MAVGGRGARLQHHVRAKRGGEEGLGGRPSLQGRVVRAIVCCAAPTIMDSVIEILESHDHSDGEKHVCRAARRCRSRETSTGGGDNGHVAHVAIPCCAGCIK